MKYSVVAASPAEIVCDCLVVGVYENGQMTPGARAVDQATGGAVSDLLSQQDAAGKAETLNALYRPAGLKASRLLVAGFGESGKVGENDFLKTMRQIARTLHKDSTVAATLASGEVRVAGRNAQWNARQTALILENAAYVFQETKPSAKPPATPLESVTVTASAATRAGVRKAVDQGVAIASGMIWTRQLGDLPPNLCTPRYLARQARSLIREDSRFTVKSFGRRELEKRNMGAFLAVAQGSPEEPQLIVVEYRGRARTKAPVALVGKGVTFDTGGISIKPSSAMDEMKFDMCGAGSVLGTLKAAAALNLPQHLVGIIPATENMPGGRATRPGDVVTTASGQTVEILNTDAEGRLILCDALDYALSFKPRLIIDIATLTGACLHALGKHASGLFTYQNSVERALVAAGRESWDRVWPLPLWDDYQPELDSNFADIANIGERYAGATTAACFLSRFVGDTPWAHLDIAGTAWNTGKSKGATGRPVPLLTHFLMKDAQKS